MNTTDSKGEAIRLCLAMGLPDNHACVKLAQAYLTSRASLAAVPNHALTQLLESALLHPESAEGNIRQVIGMLNAAVSSSLPAEPPQDDGWVTFGRVKVDIENETETFERIPPAEPRQEGEQERKVQCADCLQWIKRDENHTCQRQIRRNQRHAK